MSPTQGGDQEVRFFRSPLLFFGWTVCTELKMPPLPQLPPASLSPASPGGISLDAEMLLIQGAQTKDFIGCWSGPPCASLLFVFNLHLVCSLVLIIIIILNICALNILHHYICCFVFFFLTFILSLCLFLLLCERICVIRYEDSWRCAIDCPPN